MVSPHPAKNQEATHVLQGWHAAKPRHGVEELDGERGGPRAGRPKEVEEAAVLGVLHRLLDELADLSFPVGVRLRPEAEQT